MPKVQRAARLHESTVQKVAKGETLAQRSAKVRHGKVATPVRIIKPHEDVWKWIKDLGIDPKRVQRFEDGSVIVWNHPAPWPQEK